MIRRSRKEDIDRIVELWFQVSLEAHSFIKKEYWEEAKQDMKEKYIPMSDTYVIDKHNEIAGFISMVDNYLAAVFVDSSLQRKGYGKKLLDFVKEDRDSIELKVFKKNKRAFEFYVKNGFTIKKVLVNENFNEK